MSKETDIDYALDLVRLLIGIVKNEEIPDSEADKNIGQMLAKLDVVMQRIDDVSLDNNTSIEKITKKRRKKNESNT